MLDNDLELGYSRAKGYTLHGSEWNKHRLAFQMVSELLESSIGIWGVGLCFIQLGVFINL